MLAAGVDEGEPRARALSLLKRWGWNATAFQALERGFRHFFVGDDACVAYVDTGGAWVVAGAPVAPPDRLGAVSAAFVRAARAAGRRACFFAVESRFVEATGYSALLVGEQPAWEPRRWSETLAARRSLREQLRRARAKGVVVRTVSAAEMSERTNPMRRAVEALVERWLAARTMPKMAFLVDVQPFEFAEERRYFVASRGGAIVGFLGAVPIFARGGWLFEDLLRDPRAPNGTAELLFDAGMRAVQAEGSGFVTLGLAPLAGAVPPWLGRLRRWTSPLYDFEGLQSFKSKLAPSSWEPILLAYPEGASPSVALYDVLAAFAGGTFLGFGLRTLLRGPAQSAAAFWDVVRRSGSPG